MIFSGELWDIMSSADLQQHLQFILSQWDVSLSEEEGASLRRWRHTAAMAQQSSSRKDMLSVRINHRAHHRKQIPLISNFTH